ncbi:MAG: hypothetical protein AB7U73_21720 [Pirellulales bacterium]
MKNAFAVLRGIVWPPAAPVGNEALGQRAWWRTNSLLLVIPFTAAFHHAIFYRPTCMLNSFRPGGEQATDYTAEATWLWLTGDPSLYLGIVAAVLVWVAGRRTGWVRRLAAPVFVSFLPLSVWIWDIPGSGRWICHTCHDGRLSLVGHVIRSRDLYLAGIAAYLLLLGLGFLSLGMSQISPIARPRMRHKPMP